MTFSKGLDGVVVDATAISNVEGDIGRLTYRGYAIEELVEQDYISVAWLVLFGEFPSTPQRNELNDFLLTHAHLTHRELKILTTLGRELHSMQMLQAMIPLLEPGVVQFAGLDAEAARGLAIIARIPEIIAAWYCLQNDRKFVPDESPDYLQRFLSMFTGERPGAEALHILKVVQILQMEHSFNAGTFATMCVSSTLAPVESVLSAGVGALAGKLHGGADEAALEDARRVGSPESAAGFIRQLLAEKGKLMGMGHREYRVVDPRAVILKPLAERASRDTEQEVLFKTLEAMEASFNAAMKEKGKEVWANLEFYKGPAYEVVGIPSDYFTAVFAMSRAIGWLAHFIETRADNRIFRPRAEYTGPAYRTLESQA